MKRTHYCGLLTKDELQKEVVVMGWVQRRRDLGGVIFIDLRDREGICQVVIDASQLNAHEFTLAEKLRNEYVIAIKGVVEKRSLDTINLSIPTGDIDVRANTLMIYSESKNTPFGIEESMNVREDLRLKYRYLDMRNPRVLENLKMRQKVTQAIRTSLLQKGFLEMETPILTKSTPEGARDFLVPSRIKKEKFYALPQSPQIYKQLLMVGGIDKYFQVAKCFRDEDLRADRQPEFTQVDMELSFVDEEDVISLLEQLFIDLLKESHQIEINHPFKRLTYKEAMSLYGTDKPDLRFEMPIVDLTKIVAQSKFGIFTKAIASGSVVKALTVKAGDEITRSQIDYLTKRAFEHGGSGMAWISIGIDGQLKSVLTKYFTDEQMVELIKTADAQNGDLIVFCAEPLEKAQSVLGNLRLDIADMLDLRPKDKFTFAIVTEFPLFEYDPIAKRLVAMHHPFTMPVEEDIDKFSVAPLEMRAKAYDIVLNGVELGSGSIRIHNPKIQQQMFETLGMNQDTIDSRFGFLIDAFEYGVPPHGGFAFGLDRLLMLLSGSSSIREVIPFPKMRDGSCAMTDSPSQVDQYQLEELHIRLMTQTLESPKVEKESLDRIDYVANLARIELTEKERTSFSRDLSDIIAFADQLNGIDLSGYEPLTHVATKTHSRRKDKWIKSTDVETLLKNAPSKVESYIHVPRTVEKEGDES